jgi:hypothetical protein
MGPQRTDSVAKKARGGCRIHPVHDSLGAGGGRERVDVVGVTDQKISSCIEEPRVNCCWISWRLGSSRDSPLCMEREGPGCVEAAEPIRPPSLPRPGCTRLVTQQRGSTVADTPRLNRSQGERGRGNEGVRVIIEGKVCPIRAGRKRVRAVIITIVKNNRRDAAIGRAEIYLPPRRDVSATRRGKRAEVPVHRVGTRLGRAFNAPTNGTAVAIRANLRGCLILGHVYATNPDLQLPDTQGGVRCACYPYIAERGARSQKGITTAGLCKGQHSQRSYQQQKERVDVHPPELFL